MRTSTSLRFSKRHSRSAAARLASATGRHTATNESGRYGTLAGPADRWLMRARRSMARRLRFVASEPAMNASDIMTESPMTVLESTSLREAIELLQTLEVRHLPVVTPAGEIRGMLSDRDIRNSGTPYTLLPERAGEASPVVVDVMTRDVVSVTSEAELREIIDLMLEHRVGALPVVDPASERLLGIVSYVDVLRGVRELD
jgi:acetoin utilization protein AcuB